jgi:hypothetical protein
MITIISTVTPANLRDFVHVGSFMPVLIGSDYVHIQF